MTLPEAAIQRVVLARLSVLPRVHVDRINVTLARAAGRPVRSQEVAA